MNNMTIEEYRNMAVRYYNGRIYYFDENGIYRSVGSEDKYKLEGKLKGYRIERRRDRKNGHPYSRIIINGIALLPRSDGDVKFSRFNRETAVNMLKEGDSLEYLFKLLQNPDIIGESLERFITKIGQPEFERAAENPDPKTFDFIRVDINVISSNAIGFSEDRFSYIKKFSKEIIQLAFQKIEQTTSFKKYGIPINFLKVSSITFSKRLSLIQVVFELKS